RERLGVAGEGVAHAVSEADHVLQHPLQRALGRAEPTNIVPCAVTVPYGMLRRKTSPNRSWSVREMCESGGCGSSSVLSALARPMTFSCAVWGRDSQAGSGL